MPCRGTGNVVDAMMYAGFVLLIASGVAVLFNRRVRVEARPALWRKLWTGRWPLGVLLALASIFMHYRVGPAEDRWLVRGVPFPAAFIDSKGSDYVGPLTGTFMALNCLFWLVLPQFVLWVTSGRRDGLRTSPLDRPTPAEPVATTSGPERGAGPGPSR